MAPRRRILVGDLCTDIFNFLSAHMFCSVSVIHYYVFSDTDRYEMQAVSVASPMKSPHGYSPSVYSYQVALHCCAGRW